MSKKKAQKKKTTPKPNLATVYVIVENGEVVDVRGLATWQKFQVLEPRPHVMVFNHTEICTIIAALRYYQANGMGDTDNRPDWLQKLACPDGGNMTSLDDKGIDALAHSLHPAISNGQCPICYHWGFDCTGEPKRFVLPVEDDDDTWEPPPGSVFYKARRCKECHCLIPTKPVADLGAYHERTCSHYESTKPDA